MNEENRENVQWSKYLSYVLRHRPDSIGLALEDSGWANLETLMRLANESGQPITIDIVHQVVATNDKKRFEISPDGTRIRARQGHSVSVDLGYSTQQPPELLYHGTAERNVRSILQDGLNRGERHHVHLSPDPETAMRVGQRYGTPVVLEIQAGAMHRDGLIFFLTGNGVWLTDSVPPRYVRISGEV